MNARIALLAILAAALAGCVNPYVNNFHYAPGVTPTMVTAKRAGTPPATPEVIEGSSPATDIANQEADGYMPFGYADFSATPGFVPRDGAIKQGESIGADRILVYSKYQGTVTTAIPITTPTQQTTYYNGTATVYGSGGTATGFGSGTATTYGSQTHFMPLRIAHYEYLAIYLIKAKIWFGGVYKPVTPQQSQIAGSVDAVQLSVIVRGTPAAEAGLLPGDIVTQIDGKPFDGAKSFMATLQKDAGLTAYLTIIRNGGTISKAVPLPAL